MKTAASTKRLIHTALHGAHKNPSGDGEEKEKLGVK